MKATVKLLYNVCLKCTQFISLSLHSMVGWFMAGLGLKIPQLAVQTKDDAQVIILISNKITVLSSFSSSGFSAC